MSKAGVESNRGDAYQTIVAFDWALKMLANEEIDSIEVDSTSLDAAGSPVSVDDVVVRFKDGDSIYCQCKKNQPVHASWGVIDLSDDLKKAARLLVRDRTARIHFYSRSPFGELARLRNHATAHPNNDAYVATLAEGLKETHKKLEDCWKEAMRSSTSTDKKNIHDLLCRVEFLPFDKSIGDLKSQLRFSVSNAEAAFNSLWTHLNQLSARLSVGSVETDRHRLTRVELRRLLESAGSAIAPPRSYEELVASFSRTSAVGRSWRRSVGQHRFKRRAVQQLVHAISTERPSILVTDGPGSGKTCLLLDLLEELATNKNLATLFIQGREFGECKTLDDYVARGLMRDVVGDIARMSEFRRVIVVIDSVDVLSLAREHATLDYFLSILDRLLLLQNVTIVCACRSFDLKYHTRLAYRQWSQIISLGELDWEQEVLPLLSALNVPPDSLTEETRKILLNPRNLAMFVDVVGVSEAFNVTTTQALTKRYLQSLVTKDAALGDDALKSLEKMASVMLSQRCLSVPRRRIGVAEDVLARLQSAEVVREVRDGYISFGHQTLLDALAVYGAERSNLSLVDFIRQLPAVPFVRPAIRLFFFELSSGDRGIFRRQVRAALDGEIAFHIKRLIAESFAELEPHPEDWQLLQYLYREHSALFDSLYERTQSKQWYTFWQSHLAPLIIREQQSGRLERHVGRLGFWKRIDADGVVKFWTDSLQHAWIDQVNLKWAIVSSLHSFQEWKISGLRRLFELLLDQAPAEHEMLGIPLSKWVEASDSGDDLVWKFITRGITENDLIGIAYNDKLHCSPHEFVDADFLKRRMKKSEALLDIAIDQIKNWSCLYRTKYELGENRAAIFLDHTLYGQTHSRLDMRFVTGIDLLLTAVEEACVEHARQDTEWWRKNEEQLRRSTDWALIFICIHSYSVNPTANVNAIGSLLASKDILESKLGYEIGNLIRSSFHLLGENDQDLITENILELFGELNNAEDRDWVLAGRYDLLTAIPAFLRTSEAQRATIDIENRIGFRERSPNIERYGGLVPPPFFHDVFFELSDDTVLALLAYYANSESGYSRLNLHIGGADQVGAQLRLAASLEPLRFASLLFNRWNEIPIQFSDDLLDGIGNYIRHRFGNLSPASNSWTPRAECDPLTLSGLLLAELERHRDHWRGRREAAGAVRAVAHVIESDADFDRLMHISEFIAFDGAQNDSDDLITSAINSTCGVIAEATLDVAIRWVKDKRQLSELVSKRLLSFASDPIASVRAALLLRLAYFQYLEPELGWRIFHLIVDQNDERLWSLAEKCLYHEYHGNFERVAGYLSRIVGSNLPSARETWGRISTLACLSGHISWSDCCRRLTELNDAAAWNGAVSVLSANTDKPELRDMCFVGLQEALDSAPDRRAVANQMDALFRGEVFCQTVPISLIRSRFTALGSEIGHMYAHGFDEWLSKLVESLPAYALEAAEVFAEFATKARAPHYDHKHIARLLNRLFGEAEEAEESDGGVMLRRVISLQDNFLACGIYGLHEWLRDAERP